MIHFDHLQAALSIQDYDPLPAHALMAPLPPRMPSPDRVGTPPRRAGVLALIYPEAGELYIVLTRRTENLRGHSGQISFPGGKHDPDDESFVITALRETCEELGLCDHPLTIIGTLAPVYIPPSHFEVFPSVAYTQTRPQFSPNPDEVAEVLRFSLQDLLDERTKQSETREIQGFQVRIPYYLVGEHKVWGATAVMLSELEHRLRKVLPVKTPGH